MPSPWQLERWQQRAYRVWTIVGALLLLAVAGWVLQRISAALVPFVMAFVLTFLLAWPVRAMEARGMRRGVAALLAIVALLVGVGLLVTFIAPVLARQFAALATDAPKYIADAQQSVESVQSTLRGLIMPQWVRSFLNTAISQLGTAIASAGSSLAGWLLNAASQALTLFLDAFIALVITFWALRDLPTIRDEILVVSGKWREDVELLFAEVGKSMGGYLRGQTIASLCTGGIAMVGLFVVGIPYAFLLGALAFILNYIPYVGPFVTALLAGLVGLFDSPLKGILGVAIVILAQQLTDNLITPRVMSSEVNLHPTLIIFSLLLGGSLFGFAGLIFAIPVAAALQGVFIYYFERSTSSQLATPEGALFKTDECDEDGQPCEDTEAAAPTTDGDTGK